jgi:hypothetical protein
MHCETLVGSFQCCTNATTSIQCETAGTPGVEACSDLCSNEAGFAIFTWTEDAVCPDQETCPGTPPPATTAFATTGTPPTTGSGPEGACCALFVLGEVTAMDCENLAEFACSQVVANETAFVPTEVCGADIGETCCINGAVVENGFVTSCCCLALGGTFLEGEVCPPPPVTTTTTTTGAPNPPGGSALPGAIIGGILLFLCCCGGLILLLGPLTDDDDDRPFWVRMLRGRRRRRRTRGRKGKGAGKRRSALPIAQPVALDVPSSSEPDPIFGPSSGLETDARVGHRKAS